MGSLYVVRVSVLSTIDVAVMIHSGSSLRLAFCCTLAQVLCSKVCWIYIYLCTTCNVCLVSTFGALVFSVVVCLLWSFESCWLIDIFVSSVRICATTNILPVFCLERLNMIMFIGCNIFSFALCSADHCFFIVIVLLFAVCYVYVWLGICVFITIMSRCLPNVINHVFKSVKMVDWLR